VPSGTILLVDDDDAIRHVIRVTLERHGYDVVDVAEPSLAITLFEQDPSAIDLLVTDVRMPGMSGPALADRLAFARPELPVVFMTGGLDAAQRPQLRGSQHRVLAKPFHAAALLDLAGELLSIMRR